MRKLNFIAFLFVILISCSMFVSAIESLGTFKINECVELKQTCSNCTYVNISSVLYPNSSKALQNVEMTGDGVEYSYDFCSTTQLGSYIVNGYADVDATKTVWAYDFEITGNGKDNPQSAVVVLFIGLFIFILVFMTYLVVYSLGHVIKLDFDIMDLAWNYGIFFALVAMLMFQNFYLGNPEIQDFLKLFVNIGIFTSVFLPTIYFILTLTVGSWMQKRVKGVDF